MTKKKLFSTWTWREYLLQLSVVIAGIMVTFIGSDLIGRWSHARQVKATMQLVVEELKTNREHVAHVCEYLRYDRAGILMFERYDKNIDAVSVDSLEHYVFIMNKLRSIRLQDDALEVLKTSGLIPAIADKQLLMQILGTYKELEGFCATVEIYNKRKIDAMNHYFANSYALRKLDNSPRESWRALLSDPLCASFIGTSAYFFSDGDYLTSDIGEVGRVVSAINEKYEFE